jgi:hypothetical protein
MTTDNLDSQSFGNFSIENTMEMGLGNADLLNDLIAPETSTTNPDDLQDIKKDEIPPTETKKTNAPKADKSAPAEGDTKDPNTSIQDFLLGGDDNDEEDADVPPAPAKTTSKDNTTSEDGEDEGTEEVSRFTALSNDLFKLGVFSKDEDEEDTTISTPEEFLERFQAEKKKGAIEVVNNFIGQFGEDYQKAFDAIFVKGVKPEEYFGAFGAIQNFNDIDLTQESNQISVLKQALTDQGYDPEDITTEIERLKNYGDLESVAGKHHKVLIKKETAKLQQLEQTREVELQQQNAIKQEYYKNVQSVLQDKLKAKEFDGIPLNPKLASELQDFLLTDKYKTNSGEKLTDFDKTILELKRPENHEKKVKLGLLLKILEKDPTLSTIQKTGLTKKSNELFGEVARQANKSSVKSSKPATQSSSWFA